MSIIVVFAFLSFDICMFKNAMAQNGVNLKWYNQNRLFNNGFPSSEVLRKMTGILKFL